MLYHDTGTTCEGLDDKTCHSTSHHTKKKKHKPIEIYSFIDPVCPKCWGLEPILRKLVIEYGQYITLKHLIGVNLDVVNRHKSNRRTNKNQLNLNASTTGMSWDDDEAWFQNPPCHYTASIAVKAAEMQGKTAGHKFLRKLREKLFLENRNISDDNILIQCAEEAELDINEFIKDMKLRGTLKALQCDMRITSEMNVTVLPTLVFFNLDTSDEGIKVTGDYPYEVYVQILTEMLGERPVPNSPPDLLDFMKKYKFVATKEIGLVYNYDCSQVEREMKKFQLKQLVEKVPVKHGTFWRYIAD